MLALIKANLIIKRQKVLAVSKWSYQFLKTFLPTILCLNNQIHIDVCNSLEVFFYILGTSFSED